MAPKLVLKVFCAQCQKETPHEATMDRTGELLLSCDCGRFVKTPRLEPSELTAHLASHKESNQGRIPLTKEQIAAQEAEQMAIAGYLDTLKKAPGAKLVTT